MMAEQRERDVAYGLDYWVDAGPAGSIGYVSSEKPDAPPVILVPDGAGDYREHQVGARPKGRLGF